MYQTTTNLKQTYRKNSYKKITHHLRKKNFFKLNSTVWQPLKITKITKTFPKIVKLKVSLR